MKRLPALIMMLSFIIVLVSYDNQSDDLSLSYKFTYNGQRFEIISLYREVLHYTALIKKEPSLDNKLVYYEKVILPFYDLAKKKNIAVDGYHSYFSPTRIEQKLEDNTLELFHMQEGINTRIQQSIVNSANLLPGKKKTIFVMPFNPDHSSMIADMEGVTGVAFNENVMLLQIDPSYSEKALDYVVAHEYNHTIAMENRRVLNNSLLTSIILEGKADSFAGILYPDQIVPWLEPLSIESEKMVFDEIREHLGSAYSSLYDDLLLGSGRIPRWSNYKIGYTIMQSFLKNNPDLSIGEWTRLGAKKILQGSDYWDLLTINEQTRIR